MTLGDKIKNLRIEKGISQEKLAEELNVSRSAIAKWETNGGIPEVSNLILIAKIFEVSIDTLVEDIKSLDKEANKTIASFECYSFLGKYVDIELDGWNDGIYDVLIVNEDNDFIFYQKVIKKKKKFGMLAKRFITSINTLKKADEDYALIEKKDRNYFCHKHVMLELAAREGFLKGFFDFRNDDYLDVVIALFEETKIKLQYGKEIDLKEITKIEEKID